MDALNCLELGKICWISSNGHTHIFPFYLEKEGGHAEERKNHQMVDFAERNYSS